VEAEEAVGENAALEERAQLTLDEARDVSGCSSYLSRFSHEAIVVSSAYRRHVAKGIAFPPHNGCVSV